MRFQNDQATHRANVERLMGTQRSYELMIPDQPWNPFSSAEPLMNGFKASARVDNLLNAQIIDAWNDGLVAIISPTLMQHTPELREAKLVGGWTLLPNAEGNLILLQCVVMRDFDVMDPKRVLQQMSTATVYAMNRNQVAGWDGGFRKEPPTRRSVQMQAVRPPE